MLQYISNDAEYFVNSILSIPICYWPFDIDSCEDMDVIVYL